MSEIKDIARPRFYKEAIQNKAKSEQEGRPIFDEREMVEIKLPGDRLSSHVSYVMAEHRDRWPEIYAAFQRGEERAASGTPLEHWTSPSMTRARVAELKAANILSVEELSGVPDNVLPRLGMGARELREQARAYLDSAKDGAGNAAMAAELARLREMVERLSSPATEPLEDKPIEECSDSELKTYIKNRTGEPVRGNPSRETLLARASELATATAEAA